jgi:DNA-directed RNA polymerase subunit E'/Rpb7
MDGDIATDIFIRVNLTDKIKVKPRYISSAAQTHIMAILTSRYEGKCTWHGYIKPGSIDMQKCSVGMLQDMSLNGDVIYNVNYMADVCNPIIGCTVRAKVVNMNMFGILAENSIDIDGEKVPILDVIVVKSNASNDPSVDIEAIKIGDFINIEVLGKKYELNDKKMTVVGKIIKDPKQVVLAAASGGGALDSDLLDDADVDADADHVDIDILDDMGSEADADENASEKEEEEDADADADADADEDDDASSFAASFAASDDEDAFSDVAGSGSDSDADATDAADAASV